MTKKFPKKILRIERNFFVNLRKKCFWPPTPRRRRFFWPGGAPPPTEIDRRAAADTMTSADSSSYRCAFLKLEIWIMVQGFPTKNWLKFTYLTSLFFVKEHPWKSFLEAASKK